jgi:uncharacterized protein YndB with AHSA1/START domain
MTFQENLNEIRWRLHLNSPPVEVYRALSTDQGRAGFWAESAREEDGMIHFVFPNGLTWDGQVLRAETNREFAVRYFGGSISVFTLADDGQHGTDLNLTDSGVLAGDRVEVIAGWVSVLLALKAWVDFGIDLRGHDPDRTWDSGYVDN